MAQEEILAPPSWDVIEADPEYQKLTPEDQAITLSNWAKSTRSYGDEQGWWQDPETQKQFTESTRGKLSEIQSKLPRITGASAGVYGDNPIAQAVGTTIDRADLGLQEFAPRAMGAADQLVSLATRLPEAITVPTDAILGTDLTKRYQEFNKIGKELNRYAQFEQQKAQGLAEAGRALGGGPNIPYLGRPGDLLQESVPTTFQAAMDIGLSGGAGTTKAIEAPVRAGLKGATEAIMRATANPAVVRSAYVAGGEQALATLNQEIAQRVEAGSTPEEAQTQALPKAITSGLVTMITTRFGGTTGAESVLKESGVEGLKNRIKEVLKEGEYEAVEETLDQAANQIAGWMSDELDPTKKKEGTWQERLDKAVDLSELTKSGFLGFAIGSGITGIGQATEAAQNRIIGEQAVVQSANLEANGAPQTARAVEEVAAGDIVENKVRSQRNTANAIDELLGEQSRAAEILSETAAPEEFTSAPEESSVSESQFAPPPSLPTQETTGVSVEEQPLTPEAARARVEEALATGQEPNPADVELAGAAIASAQPTTEDAQQITGSEAPDGSVQQPEVPQEDVQLPTVEGGEGIPQGGQEEVTDAPTQLEPPLPAGEEGILESASADQPATVSGEPAVADTGAQPSQQQPIARVQLKGTPASFTVVEKIPQTEAEKERGEQFYRVVNERTSEEQVVEQADIAREIRPKSERVKAAIKKLPSKAQAKAEIATEIDSSPDPYQGAPLSSAAPLDLDDNLEMLEELSEYGVLDENATAATVLQKIKDSPKSDSWQKRLATRLLELGMGKLGVQAVYRPDSTWSALYQGPDRPILFNLARSNPGVPWATLHEAVHEVTLSKIRNPEKLTGESKKAYQDLASIFEQVSKRPEFQGEYGIASTEEMVAEAFSNAGFRRKLDAIKDGPKTLWQKLVNAITRLIYGKPADYNSLLHKTIENAFTLAGAPIIESRSNGTAAMAESPEWRDAIGNNNASEEAEAKAFAQMGEEILDETDLAKEDIKPLTPEQRDLLMPTDEFNPIGLANFWAKKFNNIKGSDHSDRVSEAIAGLVQAARTFNPEAGIPFFQWANQVIRNHMTNYARNRKVRNKYVVPDRPKIEDDETETIVSTHPSPEDISIQERDKARMQGIAAEALNAVMERTTERDRNILKGYASGQTMREVASANGVSPEGVRKIILKYPESVEKALLIRGITDIKEIIDQPTESNEQAIPTRRRTPFDEESADRQVTGSLEEQDIQAEAPILGEDAKGLPGTEEGSGFDTSEQEGMLYFRSPSSVGDTEVAAYQSAPLEAQLRDAIEKRPEISAVLSKFGGFFSRLGVKLDLWNERRFLTSSLVDGTPVLRVDPSLLATEPAGYIEAALDEEGIHILDNAISLPEFQQSGYPVTKQGYQAWASQKATKMLDEFMDAAAHLPDDEARAVGEAMVGAYNVYHMGADGPSVKTPNELKAVLDNPPATAFLDKMGFLHEFARMLVQQERNGRITEETARTFLQKIGDFIRQGLDALRRVSGLVQQSALKNTALGRLTNDLIALADENLPPRNSVAPMAERQRGGEDITNPRGPIDQGSVAPLSERGRKTRTPILRVTEGAYKPEGILRAAGKWSQNLYKLLRGKEQKTRAAISRMQFVDRAFQKELQNTFTKNGVPIPTQVINTALGNTDNRLTQEQAQQARTIQDPEARKAFVAEAKLQNLEAFKAKQADALESLPENIQKGVTEMREMIDSLSRELIKEGDISPDLKGTIDENIGTYLHRSYAIFDGDEWTDFINSKAPEAVQIRNRAESLFADYIRAQKAREYAANVRAGGGTITAKAALQAVQDLNIQSETETMLADYLAVADGSVVDTLRGRLPGQKNQSILKLRGDIPKEIRDLWGQHDDASLNFAKTYASIATFLENNKFLRGVLADGLQEGYLWKEGVSQGPRPAGYVEIVGGEGAKSMAPLAGTYGPPILRDAFQEYVNPLVQDWLGTITTAAMKAKTVYSIGSIVRNFIGNPGFMLANGNVFTGNLGDAAQTAWANFRKMGDKEWREKTSRMYELGVFGDNIGPQVLKELSQRAKKLSSVNSPAQGLLKSMGEKLSGVRETFEGVYSGVDDFWKVYAFDSEYNKLRWANPDAPQAELEQQAADIVRNTVPTYSESPQIVRSLFKGQVGKFVAPFITFTTEVIRVTYGAAKQTATELQSSNPRIKAIGAARLAGLMAIATLPGIIEEASKSMFGYDDDDEEALRSGLPEWQKNATLLFLPPDAKGNVRFVDLSYLNPYNYFTDTIKAITRGVENGDSPTSIGQQALTGATGQLFGPFLSEQIAFGAYADVIRNQKANGTDVYNPQDRPENIAKDVTWRLMQPFIPGTVDSAIRIYKASQGEVNPAGKQYDLMNEIMSPVLGQRISTNDRNQVFQFQVGRFNGTRNDAAKLFSETFSNQGTVKPGDVADAYARANEARMRIYQSLRDNYLGSLALGMTKKEAVDIMKSKGAGEDAINQVLSGTYWRYEPSAQSIRKVQEQFPERVAEFRQAFRATPARTAFKD